MSSTTRTTDPPRDQRRSRRRASVLVAFACAGAAVLSVQHLALTRPRGDGVAGGRRLRLLSMSVYEIEDEDAGLSAIPGEGYDAVSGGWTIPHPLSVVGDGDGDGDGMVDEIKDEDAGLLAMPGEGYDGDGGRTTPRPLSVAVDGKDDGEDDADGEDDGIVTHARLIDEGLPLPPYAIDDAVRTSRMYDTTWALLVYDPEKDSFYALYSKRHFWVTGCTKLLNSFGILTSLLRRTFPERFQGAQSDELVIPISGGDYPAVKVECLDHFRRKAPGWRHKKSQATCGDGNPAPILHFGSVYRQPRMFPNMIGMPMPSPEHLYCLENWAIRHGICSQLRARTESDVKGGMVYGDEAGLVWEDLIPQVVWRGTDFSYLTRVYPRLRKPIFDESLIKWPQEQDEEDQLTNKIFGRMTAFKASVVMRRLDRVRKRAPRRADHNIRRLDQFNKAAAVKAMREQYDNLLPRWKAVVLTGEAEVDAAASAASAPDNVYLPWANMKFSNFVENGQKTHTEGSDSYKDWESIGFPATGDYMTLPDLARYKYHIDLAGGGGTTWTGTIQKLAMPGLLFHHMTPTKDYFHDYMRPWVHYIPVSSDLRDLKRKYDWAESNPIEARRIADAGTNLARYLTSPNGIEDIFNLDVVEPLRRVIEAYQPISVVHERTSWRNWRESIRQIEDDVLVPVYECESWSRETCGPLQGRDWVAKTFSVENKRHRFG